MSSKHVSAYELALFELIANPNSLNGGYGPPLATHPPSPTRTTLIYATRDITVAVKKLARSVS